MKKYKITLKHDNGIVKINVYANNEEMAIKTILEIEKAPKRAILKIKELNMKKTYKQLKEEARQRAIDWQLDFGNHNYSWGELAYYSDYFEKLGKRYGLLREFKENGIV